VPERFQADGSANVDELAEAGIDVVFTFGGGDILVPYRTAGVTAVNVEFSTYDELARSVAVAGDVLGGAARERAKAYDDYLDRNVDLVESRLADLPTAERPSVLHIRGFPPIGVDGGNNPIWVRVAGATNAASASGTISTEELSRLDPDVIFMGLRG